MSLSLAGKIQRSGEKFDCIVAISRGGLVLARILSDFLDIPIFNISIKSYRGVNRTNEPQVVQDLCNGHLEGKRAILADEICDSGATIELAMNHLQKFKPQSIKTVCLFSRSNCEIEIDFLGEKEDKWIIFPYEVKETLDAIKSKQLGNGLYDFGMPKDMVDWYVKNFS